MNSKDLEIARENLHSILKYRAVLSRLLKRPVSLEQAMADWLEQGYHRNNANSGSPDSYPRN